MAIENLGSKLYSGIKTDRVSDSLGSSADGTNTGITLVTTSDVTSQYANNGSNSSGAANADRISAWKITASVSGTANAIQMKFYQYSASQRVRVAIYDGDSSTPNNLLNSSSEYTPANTTDWQSFTIPNTTITSGSVYWLAVWSNENMYLYADTGGATGQKIKNSITYSSSTAFTDPSADDGSDGGKYNVGISILDSNAVKLGTGCYSFDGSDDYVQLGDNMLLGASTFTVAGWIYPTDVQSGIVFSQWSATANSRIIHFYTDVNSGNLYIIGGLRNGSSSTNIYAGDGFEAELTMNAWNHVAVTFDGSAGELKLYLNGVLKDTVSSGLPSTTQSGTTSNKPLIGKYYANQNYFEGRIDDMGIWNRVLTATEISDLVNETDKATDVTDDLTTDKGWASNTSDWEYNTSDYLDFATIRRSTTSQEMYIDLQDSDYLGTNNNLHASKWVVRLGKFTTGTLASSGNVMFFIGFSNSSGADSGESQQSVFTNINFSTTEGGFFAYGTTNNLESGTNRVTSEVLTPLVASKDYWIEMSRNGDVFTVKTYSDEYTTQSGSNSVTKTGISGLRYLKILNDSEQNGGTATGSKLYGDIKIWNGTTSVTTPTGALVSSLSDKSNLKANYTMDSTSLGATALLDTDFSSNTGWTIPDSSYIDITNNQIEFEAPTDSNTVRQIRYDFGENVVNTTKWVLRAKIDVTTLTASGGVGKQFFIGMKSGTGGQNVDYVGIRWRVQASPNNNAWFDSEVNGMPTSGSGASLVAPEVKTYYMEMKRLTSANTEVTLYNNSDYTGVYQSTVTDTGGASLGDLRYFTIHFQGNSGGSSAFAGTVDDVEFYNGVTSLDGCKNDFSSTSDLDGLTGVRTNSIFQQTDDTPSYWWYDGTTWKLDGITMTYESDFANSQSGWTAESYNGGSTSNGGVDTTGIWGKCNSSSASAQPVVYYDIGSALPSKWIMRFRTKFDSTTKPSNYNYFGIQDATTVNGTDGVWFYWSGGTNKADGTSSLGDPSTAYSITGDQWYYWELIKDGTSGTLKKYGTDSTYSSGSTQNTFTASSGTDIRYIWLKASSNATNETKFYVSKIQLQKGRTTWLE